MDTRRPGGYAKLQSAETVLGVLRDRGRKGLPCNELYRQMFNRDLYLLAYGRIYANQVLQSLFYIAWLYCRSA